MNDEGIVAKLVAASFLMNATDLARLLDELTGGGLSQGTMIMYFKRALPNIPLQTLLDAGGWSRLTDGGLSDAEFNELLSEWLPRKSVDSGKS